jgi:hypothetical protein
LSGSFGLERAPPPDFALECEANFGKLTFMLVSVEFSTEQSAAWFERYLKSGSGCAFARRHF